MKKIRLLRWVVADAVSPSTAFLPSYELMMPWPWCLGQSMQLRYWRPALVIRELASYSYWVDST